jgi:branched-chain amino acid transport system permease protein
MSVPPGPSAPVSDRAVPDAEQLARRSRREQRLVPSTAHAVGLVVVLAIYLLIPHVLNDLWAGVAVQAGILCIGGLGLNLLTGYAGQASLGNAAFVSIGAFTAAYLGYMYRH